MSTLPQLFEEDVRELNRTLHDLLMKTEAGAALVIDKGGFLIAQCGEYHEFDTTTLAALSAASFAATQGIASLVSETNFSSVYQQGENYSLLVVNVDEYCLLTVIFNAKLSVGAIKYYATPAIEAVAAQLKIAHDRDPGGGLDLSMANLADPSVLFRRKGE
ncbi:MAG: mglB [Verrucomicrobiales bacterium]|jgi:predicted regulator of Ras-like GTPase activity (Roadblock/LC7/MglB family)|nr:mglB [Verrucomicrobiales bacterium]